MATAPRPIPFIVAGGVTCNIAIFKEDFHFSSVYGFDETYVGWGKEDSDLAVRMEMLGFKNCVRSSRGNLFHGQQSRTALEANEAALTESMRRSSWSQKNHA